jgi:hypothetical protein
MRSLAVVEPEPVRQPCHQLRNDPVVFDIYRLAVEKCTPLPLADLDRVDLELLGQLGDGFGLLGGFQGDLGLEGWSVFLANSSHALPSV